MTKKPKLSSKEKGKLNAKKIADWVKTSPTIPLYIGNVNKTRIFKMHNVPKSTLDTNDELQELFAPDGPIEKLARQQKELEAEFPRNSEFEVPHIQNIDSITSNAELEKKVKTLEKQLKNIELDLASEEFLLATGRYIPKVYFDDSEV